MLEWQVRRILIPSLAAGSVVSGWVIQRFGFAAAFGIGAALSAAPLPYFLATDGRLNRSNASRCSGT